MPRSIKTRQKIKKLRTAKNRSVGSNRWLLRHLNDTYVEKAKQMGYRSRAAFKLIELDDRFKFLFPGAKVVDLGAAPGGWSQIAAERVTPKGRVLAVDLLPMDGLPGVQTLQLDFSAEDTPALLKAHLEGPADVVLCDMAPPSSGHNGLDHLRIMALAEIAFLFAQEVLAPEGVFVVKLWQGKEENAFLKEIRQFFSKVSHFKPASSRPESAEIYVVAFKQKTE